MKRLILFLIRRKLGLKKWQGFRFDNQKSKTDYYFFGNDALWKNPEFDVIIPSNVSLNWLLHSECKVIKLNNYTRFANKKNIKKYIK